MSMNHYNWNRDLNEIFKDSSQFYINEHLEGRISLNEMALNQPDAIHDLVKQKFLNDYLGEEELELKNSLDANCDFDFVPDKPLLIIHSKTDEVVPYWTSFGTWKSWVENGANENYVQFHPLENANHSESAFEGITVALDFLGKYR